MSPGGGIGRRASFRCWWGQPRGGSSPLPGTINSFIFRRLDLVVRNLNVISLYFPAHFFILVAFFSLLNTEYPYIKSMKTVIETPTFIKTSRKIWSEEEIEDFIEYISMNSHVGKVITHGKGLRKIRWGGHFLGKRGAGRVIYMNILEDKVVLLLAYKKGKKKTTTTDDLKTLLNELNDD